MENETIKTLITFFFSSAFVGFIQFLIQRKDNKDNKYEEIKTEFNNGLKEREDASRKRYEEHCQSIAELREVLTKLAASHDEYIKITKANSVLLVGLAQDRLFYLTDKYIQRGVITLDELATLEDIYRPYSSDELKGNGRGKAGMEKCRQLPIVSDEIAKMKDEV